MKPNDFAIFAELDRYKFENIVQILLSHFENIQYGSQGDDWIWVHLEEEEKIEIDSFFSMELEVKGKYKHLPIIKKILQMLKDELILQVFDPPKLDMIR